MSDTDMDFSGLSALFINTTLTQIIPSPPGVYPDMREHGWDTDLMADADSCG